MLWPLLGYGRRRWHRCGPTRRSACAAEAARGAVERLLAGNLETTCAVFHNSDVSAPLRPSHGGCALIHTMTAVVAVTGSMRRRRQHPDSHAGDGVLHPQPPPRQHGIYRTSQQRRGPSDLADYRRQ